MMVSRLVAPMLEIRLQFDTSKSFRFAYTLGIDDTFVLPTFRTSRVLGYVVGTCMICAQLLSSRPVRPVNAVPGGSVLRVRWRILNVRMFASKSRYWVCSVTVMPTSAALLVKSVMLVSSPMTSSSVADRWNIRRLWYLISTSVFDGGFIFKPSTDE